MSAQTLKQKIEERIAQSNDNVFLTREFADLAGASQVLRVLRQMITDKKLIRMGYGVYARAFASRLTDRPVIRCEGGFIAAARQALDKLGVAWEFTAAQLAYNEGRSTQVPVNPAVQITGRFLRKLKVGKVELRIERDARRTRH